MMISMPIDAPASYREPQAFGGRGPEGLKKEITIAQ